MDKKADELLKKYLTWPIYMMIALLIMTIIIFIIDRKSGSLMLAFSLIAGVGLGFLYIHSGKNILTAMEGFAMANDGSIAHLYKNLDVPYILMDKDFNIIWRSASFVRLFSMEGKNNIKSLIADISFEKLQSETTEYIKYHKRIYRLSLNDLSSQNTEVYALCFYDETRLKQLEKETDSNRLAIGLIYLDNYDEVIETVEEVRRSLLEALIDRKINQYFSAADGIVKKLEKDRYFFLIKKKELEKLEADRFELLEDVKNVNIGNEMSITLSVGIGYGTSKYAQKYDFARIAMDMALGRGGDQVVIKENENIRYYGGKSKTIEKSTRVKARVKAHALRELMMNKDRVIIMGHKNMDIDVFGSSIGIWKIATSLGKKANILMSDINFSLKPLVDKFLEEDYPKDLFIKEAEAMEYLREDTMLVVVDVNRPSITESPALLEKIDTIVVLDHHRQSSEIIENATLSYVEPFVSSACEMVAEIVQYISDEIKLKPWEADAMYAGIVIDTQNFTASAGVRTFEAAAFLRRKGADVIRVRKLFRDKFENHMARAATISQAEIFEDIFAISECDAKDLENPTVIGAQAANELLNIMGIKASIICTQYNGMIYVSARSMDDINVQLIMEKLGGGGHRNIAGAQLKDMTMEEAKEAVKTAISEMLKKGEI